MPTPDRKTFKSICHSSPATTNALTTAATPMGHLTTENPKPKKQSVKNPPFAPKKPPVPHQVPNRQPRPAQKSAHQSVCVVSSATAQPLGSTQAPTNELYFERSGSAPALGPTNHPFQALFECNGLVVGRGPVLLWIMGRSLLMAIFYTINSCCKNVPIFFQRRKVRKEKLLKKIHNKALKQHDIPTAVKTAVKTADKTADIQTHVCMVPAVISEPIAPPPQRSPSPINTSRKSSLRFRLPLTIRHLCLLLLFGGPGVAAGYDKLPNGNASLSGAGGFEGFKQVVSQWVAGASDRQKVNHTYGPIEDWDTSDITDMEHVFSGFGSFNADISKWNVSKVEKMNFSTSNKEVTVVVQM